MNLKRVWDSGFGIMIFIFNEFSETNGLRDGIFIKNGQFFTNIWGETRDKAVENNIWDETYREVTKFFKP